MVVGSLGVSDPECAVFNMLSCACVLVLVARDAVSSCGGISQDEMSVENAPK